MAEVTDKLKGIIADKLGVGESYITPEANFIEDLGADSLDILDLMMEVEAQYDMSIPDGDTGQLSTVGALAEYLEKQIAM